MSLWGGKRDLLESTKMDFMRLRNESTLWWSWWRFPQRLSIDPAGSWRIGLSDTKQVRRNVQSCIGTCSHGIWQWCGELPHQDLPRSDSVVWPLIHVWRLALCRARPKYLFVQYRDLAYVSTLFATAGKDATEDFFWHPPVPFLWFNDGIVLLVSTKNLLGKRYYRWW